MKMSSRMLWIASAACLFWFVGAPRASLSQSPPASAQDDQSGRLQLTSMPLPNGTQQLVVLDPNARTLAVYHVEGGNVQLRCVRNLAWDLRMEEFNGLPPLPSELRRAQN